MSVYRRVTLERKKTKSKGIAKRYVLQANLITTTKIRGRSRAAATPKMERFVIIVNGWKPLTIITKRSILDVAAALYQSLKM